MALEGPGRLGKPTSNRTMVYIGMPVASDSAFPFEKGDALWVRIDGDRLIIEKRAD